MFQAKQQINFGVDAMHNRMRETAHKASNADTKATYAYTSARRHETKQKVYSVNIPFSKYQDSSRPSASASSPDKTQALMMRSDRTNGFS